MAKSVVGLIDDPSKVEPVVEELLQSGFEKKDIGMVAQDVRSESERVLASTRKGAVAGVLAGTLLTVSAVLIPGLGPAFVAGPVGVLLASSALGALAGGLVGALRGSGLAEKDAQYYAEGVRRGGVLVIVDAESEPRAALAREIMKRHGAVEVQQRAAG